jgi:NAD(P)-dependent dehydrogenase (short-subunit alcohol dehydrogenase family)
LKERLKTLNVETPSWGYGDSSTRFKVVFTASSRINWKNITKRTTLLVNIYPKDIAKGIAFFASSKSDKTTGCMLTIDEGVPAAFTR